VIPNSSNSSAAPARLHLICERDVGLFSLIQQVISQIPWALRENRIPIVYYRDRTCYWTPNGYQGSDTVWEYYFEPVVPSHPASSVPPNVRAALSQNYPGSFDVGHFLDNEAFASAHFGDHPELLGKTLPTPYLLDDPDLELRRKASEIVHSYVRPRKYVLEKADRFFEEHMRDRYVIGVHIRGTDATSGHEARTFRHGSLRLPLFARAVQRLLKAHPDALVLVATDAESSLNYMRELLGSRVIAYDSIRHVRGREAGRGPTGWAMPGYISENRDQAAKNGEEAVIEYLLLSRCSHLLHNGASLARTVLLAAPGMPHVNVNPRASRRPAWERRVVGAIHQAWIRLRNRPFFTTETFDGGQFAAGWPDWHRNGDVRITPGTGAARVTVHETLMRQVSIRDSVNYRYTLEACSEAPGAPVRLQINWHDSTGEFLGATIEVRECGRDWAVFAQDMKPPAGATTGIAIVGGHSSTPVLVRRVSLRFPVQAEEGKPLAVAW
jgi:hypothetical protein